MRVQISRRALSIFSILVLFAAGACPGAATRATSPAPSASFSIPFDFFIAGRTLPAGEYVVERSTLFSAAGLSIRNVDKNAGVYVLTADVESNVRPSDSKLIFNRYEGRYFLSEFWTAGQTNGRKVTKSGEERALEREAARGAAQPARVAVVTSQK